jgi:hypothetical protein
MTDKALSLTAASSHKAYGNLALNQRAANITICAWIKYGTIGAGTAQCIVSMAPKDVSTGAGVSLLIKEDTGSVYTNALLGNDISWLEVTGHTALTTGVWYHVAVTFDGANIKLYLNGAIDDTLAAVTSIYWTDSVGAEHPDPAGIAIGARYEGASDTPETKFFDGIIDEVVIWNSAKTASFLLADYYSGCWGTYHYPAAGIVGLWHCNEGAGVSVEDSSAEGVDLTYDGGWDDSTVCLEPKARKRRATVGGIYYAS